MRSNCLLLFCADFFVPAVSRKNVKGVEGNMIRRIFVMNLGSTSTEIAVFDETMKVFDSYITHSQEELEKFDDYWDQYEWRRSIIDTAIKNNNINTGSIDAIACRGGLLPPPKEGLVKAGAYVINDDMKYALKYHAMDPHPVNMGVTLADALAKEWGCPAYIYDAPTIDEMLPIVKITGQPGMERIGQGHPLNMRAAAIAYSNQTGKEYEDLSLIVAHLGAGISITLHKGGKMIDCISDDEGPMCPERSGGLPGFQLIKVMGDNGWTRAEGQKYMKSGGLKAYLGTTETREIQEMISEGNEEAATLFEAMALNVAKNIAKIAVSNKGEIDQIILTGNVAHSKMFCDWVRDYCGWVAPITVIPGESEMSALANGILRVIEGEEEAQTYVMQDWND
jgi:butyrate kinase